MPNHHHHPVMLKEALDLLEVKPDEYYLDGTFGQGGHTQAILDQGGKVVALDYDQRNIKAGNENFSDFIATGQLILLHKNFKDLQEIIAQLIKDKQLANDIALSGILFDFGTTSEQLAADNRGLSFNSPEQELDMRLDQTLGVKAKDLLAVLGQKQLQQIFYVYGGEREAKKISQAILQERKKDHFLQTVGELVELIEKTKSHHPRHIHPATKVFQALRIAVNNELENIELALPQALELLAPQKNLITIAFHQGEDRLAKVHFKQWAQDKKGKLSPQKPLTPSEEELGKNPRARSAKLRRFIKN